MVAQRAAIHVRAHCLPGGEVPGLRLGQSEKPIVVYVRHLDEFIT